MGNFYVNFSVKGAGQKRVADTLSRAGRTAIITRPQNGYVVAYDEEADSQAVEPILAVGGLLSCEVGNPVLAVLNHDDDILCYWLFESGELTDSYNSCPDYFGEGEDGPAEQGGDARKLCTSLGTDTDPVGVEVILRGDHVFAVEQHQQLADALGLPSWSVGSGYNYVDSCELDDELGVDGLIRVGGPGRPA
jgi:hypothetical protein